MKLRRVLAATLVAILALGGTVAAAIPGPQRAVCPQCYGLTNIGGDVFTDAPERSAELRQLVSAADSVVEDVFGGIVSHPRYVFCATAQCLAAFGGGSTGITYGWQLIRIAPQGLRSEIVTHERVHAELAARIGLRAIVGAEPLPVWFNEGLATYLAKDSRFPGPVSPADIAWIETATTRQEWNHHLAERDWIAGYGAADAAAAALVAKIGSGGLRTLIAGVASGLTFDQALAAATP